MTYTRHKKRKNRSISTRRRYNMGSPVIYIKSRTPKNVQILSEDIAEDLTYTHFDRGYGNKYNKSIVSSYAPSINEQLVSLKSTARSILRRCNTKAAFTLKEPLKIAIHDNFYGKKCVPYNTREAKQILLHNLSANKHINPKKVIPPIQIQSNCWFNAMFVTLFISDKGRKFFHYFRQLMIEGKQANGALIPDDLHNVFALLNFAIESSLTGSAYAYELDTNHIIQKIYDSIPTTSKKLSPYLVGVDEASNPFRYYDSIIDYLDNHSLNILYLQDINRADWKTRIVTDIKKQSNIKPHIIIMELFDNADQTSGPSGDVKNKPTSFKIDNAEYVLDSCVIRDIQQQHFCAMITLEGKEMGYDGMSFHRLVPMQWKTKINSPTKWSFEGSNNLNGTPLQWSFLHGYQMLIYYRVH